MARNVGLIHNQTSSLIFIIDFQIKKNKDFYNNYYISLYRCIVMFYILCLWDGECITEKRVLGNYSAGGDGGIRWLSNHAICTLQRTTQILKLQCTQELCCTVLLQPKKGFFLELQCRWRWSYDHPGKRPHASSCMWAHMQLDACGQFLLWSPDHPKIFFKQPKIPIINSCIAHVQCLIFTHFNRFTWKIFFVSQPYTAFFSQPLATPILPYRSIALQPLNECDDCPCCHFNNSLESRTRHQLKFRSV